MLLDCLVTTTSTLENIWNLVEFKVAMNVTVEEIETDPSEYLRRVLEGETLLVFSKDQPVAEIRPLPDSRDLRPIGLATGDFVVPEDFEAPLPQDILELFEGK